LSFSPDGRHLAALIVDSKPWLWDVSATPPQGAALNVGDEFVGKANFSADGHRLMTFAPMHHVPGGDKTLQTGNVFDAPDMTTSAVRVWETDSARLVGPPVVGRGGRMTDLMELPENAPDLPLSTAAITPDGRRVLVGTAKALRPYDSATGKSVGEPWPGTTDGTTAVTSLGLSSDGAYAVSADAKTSALQLRDAQTGRLIGSPMVGHAGSVWSVEFTADGKHIVSHGQDGWMLWPGPNGWRGELCHKLTANMTRAEWSEWVSPTIDYRAPCPSLDIPG
jgi:WD40 repeat protein